MNEDLPRSHPRRPYALLIVTIVSIGRALAATVGLLVVATASTAGGTGQSAPASTVVNGDNTVGIWVDGECLRQIATWDPF
jgi:hypothetical protein